MRRPPLLVAALLALFALTRGSGIGALPVFVDEAKHLGWASRLRADGELLKPLEDGKFLQVLVTAATTAGAADPLRAARLSSALAGALALLATLGIGRRLFGAGTGLLAAGLYVACPFTLFHDRLNLADPYLAAGAALSLLATLALLERPTLARALLLGLALGMSVLAKVPGLVVLAWPLLGVLLLADRRPWRELGVAYAVAVALAGPAAAYFFLRSTQLEAKASLAAGGRLELVAENLRLLATWLWAYLTPPLALAAAAGIGLALFGRRAAGERWLAAVALLGLAPFVALAYSWFPRYVLFVGVPLLVLAARALVAGFEVLARRSPAAAPALGALALAGLLAPALSFDARLLADPATAPLPQVDRFQYVQGWPSGYGWREAWELLRRERAQHPEGITIVTDRRGHRTGQWALRAYFQADPGVEVQGLEPEPGAPLRLVERWARERPTYLATSSQERRFESTARLRAEWLARFTKPGGAFACNLYRLHPREARPPSP